MGTHWASHAITELAAGRSCTVTPHGNSMKPKIESGATVTLSVLTPEQPVVGDMVLVKVRGTVYLHLVHALRGKGDDLQYQIGNNRGGINGWTSRAHVYGKVTAVVQPK